MERLFTLLEIGPEKDKVGEPVSRVLSRANNKDTLYQLVKSQLKKMGITDKFWCHHLPRGNSWEILTISEDTETTDFYCFKII